jgi:aspartate kinase
MPRTHDDPGHACAKRERCDHGYNEAAPGGLSLHGGANATARRGEDYPVAPRLSFRAMPMSGTDTLVMKFGGTSVADAERIKRAAQRIVSRKEAGTNVVAVLSARGKHTDELVSLAYEVSDRPDPREMDMLLSTGERVTCALAAMVINDLGHEAVSLTGSQAGIVTDSGHTKARIIEVKADRIRRGLEDGKIVLVAGFQGVSQESYDVTTLGRGGSDTTAVALAAALGAPVCEIYTDVAGVFSADPRIVPEARKLPVVTFEEMLEMSASGAGVLQLRSVEYARNHGVSIHCRSSFEDGPGTVVQDEEQTMERPLVTAVTHSTAEARITLTGLPDEPGIAGRVLTALAEANINVDMIIQNEPQSEGHLADMSFTVPREDVAMARESLEALQDELGFGGVQSDDRMGKVSIVGAGMKSHPGVAAKTFTVLGDAGVNIEMISTSPIKISCVVREEHVEEAVRKLHTAFELGADSVLPEDVAGVHRPKVA